MIEKLNLEEVDNPGEATLKAFSILNQLVDVVNELQKHEEQHLDLLTELNEMRLHQTKEPADPYAEQRKWIGCVCRFWYDNPNDTLLDYLDKIQTGKNGVEYYTKESGDWFSHCEPVLPTDNAIYKGGNNE